MNRILRIQGRRILALRIEVGQHTFCPVARRIMDRRGSLRCSVCGNNTNIHLVQTSNAFKLLMDELLSLGVAMRLQLEDLR